MTESSTSAVDTDTQTDPETGTPAESRHDTVADTDVDAGALADSETVERDREQSAQQAEIEQVEEGGAADESDESDADDSAGGDGMDRLENEGEIAADYLEELLDIADLDGDLDMDVEGDRAAVSIVGGDVQQLVGRNGEVLEALQELTRLAVYRETGERSRLMLDVGGFRADRRSRLEKVAAEAVEEVRSTGVRKALEAMTPFERKVVHDVVAAAGLSSSSEGEEPRRYVVVLPV